MAASPPFGVVGSLPVDSPLVSGDTTEWQLLVPSPETKRIIGKKGHIVRELQKLSDTTITVSKGHGSAALVVFTNNRMHIPSLAKAVGLTLQKISSPSVEVKLQFPILRGINSEVASLLNSLAEQEEMAGVIAFTRDDEATIHLNDAVVLTGTVATVKKALFAVLEQVVEMDMRQVQLKARVVSPAFRNGLLRSPPGLPSASSSFLPTSPPGGSSYSNHLHQAQQSSSPWRLHVSSNAARRLIGRGGSAIRRLERLSGAGLSISTSGAAAEVVYSPRSGRGGNSGGNNNNASNSSIGSGSGGSGGSSSAEDVTACALGLALSLDEVGSNESVRVLMPLTGPLTRRVVDSCLAAESGLPPGLVAYSGHAVELSGPVIDVRSIVFEVVAQLTASDPVRGGVVSYDLKTWAVELEATDASVVLGRGGGSKAEIQDEANAVLNVNFRRRTALLSVASVDGDVTSTVKGTLLVLGKVGPESQVTVQIPRRETDTAGGDGGGDSDNDDADDTRDSLSASRSFATSDTASADGGDDDSSDEEDGDGSGLRSSNGGGSGTVFAGSISLGDSAGDEGPATAAGVSPRSTTSSPQKRGGARRSLFGGGGRRGPSSPALVLPQAALAAFVRSSPHYGPLLTVREAYVVVSGEAASVRQCLVDMFRVAGGVTVNAELSAPATTQWQLSLPRTSAGLVAGKGLRVRNAIQASSGCALDIRYTGDRAVVYFMPAEGAAPPSAAASVATLGSASPSNSSSNGAGGSGGGSVNGGAVNGKAGSSRKCDGDTRACVSALGKGLLLALERLNSVDSVGLQFPCAAEAFETALDAVADVEVVTRGGALLLKGHPLALKSSFASAILAVYGVDLSSLAVRWQVTLPRERAGALIGRGGSGLKDLQASVPGVQVSFEKKTLVLSFPPEANDAAHTVLPSVYVVLGKLEAATPVEARVPLTTAAAAAAVERLAQRSDEVGRVVTLPVPPAVAVLSGRCGSVGRALKAVAESALGVLSPALELPPQCLTRWRLVIPKSAGGRVIGQNGSTVRRAEELSQSRVSVWYRGDNAQLDVTAEGAAAAAAGAVLLLNSVPATAACSLELAAFEAFVVPPLGGDGDESSDDASVASVGLSGGLDATAQAELRSWLAAVASLTPAATAALSLGDESDDVVVSGRPSAVQATIVALFAAGDRAETAAKLTELTSVTWRLTIPDDSVGNVIGRGGSVVRAVEEESGASLSINHAKGSKPANVTFDGGVLSNAAAVLGCLARLPDTDTVALDFPMIPGSVGAGDRLADLVASSASASGTNTSGFLSPGGGGSGRAGKSPARSPGGGYFGGRGDVTTDAIVAGLTVSDDETSVRIEGAPSSVEHTLVAVLDKAFELDTELLEPAERTAVDEGSGLAGVWALTLPRSSVGRVVGKGGSGLVAMQTAAGIDLSVKFRKDTAVVSMSLPDGENSDDGDNSNADSGRGDANSGGSLSRDDCLAFVKAVRLVSNTIRDPISLAVPIDATTCQWLSSVGPASFTASVSLSGRTAVVEGMPDAVLGSLLTLLRHATGLSLLSLPPPVLSMGSKKWILCLPSTMVGLILGKNGRNKKALAEECGVQVSVQVRDASAFLRFSARAGDDADETKLLTAVVRALASVEDDVGATLQLRFDSPETVSAVVRAMSDGDDVAVAEYKPNTVVVEGPGGGLAAALARTLSAVFGDDSAAALLHPPVTWTLSFPRSLVSDVVGRRGAVIKRIEAKTGTRVAIEQAGTTATAALTPNDNSAADGVSDDDAGANSHSVACALEILSVLGGSTAVSVCGPVEVGSAEVRRLPSGKATYADLVAYNRGEGRVEFSGPASDVCAVLFVVYNEGLTKLGVDGRSIGDARVDSLNPDPAVSALEVPSSSVGAVIGKGGRTLNSIRNSTGATVDADTRRRSETVPITITHRASPRGSGELQYTLDAIFAVLGHIQPEDNVSVQFPLAATAPGPSGDGDDGDDGRGSSSSRLRPGAAARSASGITVSLRAIAGSLVAGTAGAPSLAYSSELAVVTGSNRRVLQLLLRIADEAFDLDVADLKEEVGDAVAEWRVGIATGSVGVIIGKGGRTVRDIEERVGVSLRLDRGARVSDVVFGDSDMGLEKGEEVAATVLSKLDGDEDVVVQFPVSEGELARVSGPLDALLVIAGASGQSGSGGSGGGGGGGGGDGGGGSSKRKSRRGSDDFVGGSNAAALAPQVPTVVADAGLVVVRGTVRVARVALSAVVQAVAGRSDGELAAFVRSSMMGRLKGRAGETIRSIEAESGATVRTARSAGGSSEWTAVSFLGDAESVSSALAAASVAVGEYLRVEAHSFGPGFREPRPTLTTVDDDGDDGAGTNTTGGRGRRTNDSYTNGNSGGGRGSGGSGRRSSGGGGRGGGGAGAGTGAGAVGGSGSGSGVSVKLDVSEGMAVPPAGGAWAAGPPTTDGGGNGNGLLSPVAHIGPDPLLKGSSVDEISSSLSSDSMSETSDDEGGVGHDELNEYVTTGGEFVDAAEAGSVDEAVSPEIIEKECREFLEEFSAQHYLESPHIVILPFQKLLKRLRLDRSQLDWLQAEIFAFAQTKADEGGPLLFPWMQELLGVMTTVRNSMFSSSSLSV